MENKFLKDNSLNFKGRELAAILLKEDQESEDGSPVWIDFIKNARIKKFERELGFLKNPKLINNNKKLLLFLKNCVINYKLYLNRNKLIKNLKGKFFKKNINLFNVFNRYLDINFQKLIKIKNKNYYTNSDKIVIMLDNRHQKIRIFLTLKGKCKFSVTAGIIYKKLAMKQKKNKKAEKLINLMLKIISLKLKNHLTKNKCILHIKGTRSNMFNLLVLIKKNFKSNKFFFIYSPHIEYGKFKFKKVKSIKRRLKKKFSKFLNKKDKIF